MAVLMSFIGMQWFHIDANIMSLAGIAIAIGEVADLGIIISENIYQHLVEWEASRTAQGHAADGTPLQPDQRTRTDVIIDATYEVAPAVITGVSTTIVSFLPVFFLTGRDLKLFGPLAWTKTFAMVAALLVAVFLVPALCRLLLHSSRWPILARSDCGQRRRKRRVICEHPVLASVGGRNISIPPVGDGSRDWTDRRRLDLLDVARASAANRGESY